MANLIRGLKFNPFQTSSPIYFNRQGYFRYRGLIFGVEADGESSKTRGSKGRSTYNMVLRTSA